jgi:3-deoxy-7-phosphoheptulonate synthase
MTEVANINILSYEHLPTPQEIKSETPITAESAELVVSARNSFRDILSRKDHRIALVVGPCSIHDTRSGLEYAKKLSHLSEQVKDKFLILMRVYFTKPRTTTGWKGLINDPNLNDTFSISEGLGTARRFLLEVLLQGIPAATEALDAIIPQYIDDLISWNAIGARTAESQTHREMASGLSTPVGFKNGTDGNFFVAINAMEAAATPHHFLGIDHEGRCAILHTKGNPDTHIVLRGGTSPNYDRTSIEKVTSCINNEQLNARVLIDCSHGNSQKDYTKQAVVWKDCIQQIREGNSSIMGLMLESNLKGGRQDIEQGKPLEYGVSITDACISWEETEDLILEAYNALPLKK